MVALKFFQEIGKFLLALATGVLKWARENPREVFIVIVGAVIAVASWQYSAYLAHKEDGKVIETLRAEVVKANEETKARDEKIKRIEQESKANADAIADELDKSKKSIADIVSDYEKKLANEKKNYRVIYVKDKDGKEVEVNLSPQGEVVCRRFPDAFKDTVNEVVREVNKPVSLRVDTTISTK